MAWDGTGSTTLCCNATQIWCASKPKGVWELDHKHLGADHFPLGKCSHPSQMMFAPSCFGRSFVEPQVQLSPLLLWLGMVQVRPLCVATQHKYGAQARQEPLSASRGPQNEE